MGLRFRRSIRLLPGVRWNFGLKSTSISIGGRGLHYTVGTKGARIGAGLPGTGLSWSQAAPTPSQIIGRVPVTSRLRNSSDRVCERHLSRLCHISAVVTFCQSTCRATADGADAFHPLRTKLDPAVYVLNIEQTYQYESLRDKWAISPAIGRIITTSWPSGAQLTFRHPRSNTTQQKWKKSNVSI